MIEMMVALLVIIIIVQIVPLLLKTILFYNNSMSSVTDIELEFFLRDMIYDYSHTKNIKVVKNSGIKFQKDSTSYYYKFKNNKIIKEVNHSGNITMLNNVTKFKVTNLSNQSFIIDICVQDKGEKIEKTLYF